MYLEATTDGSLYAGISARASPAITTLVSSYGKGSRKLHVKLNDLYLRFSETKEEFEKR